MGKTESEIVQNFFKVITHLKIFHWQTRFFSSHKSADALVEELMDSMDEFMEIYQGMTGKRIKLVPSCSLSFSNMTNKKIVKILNEFSQYMQRLESIVCDNKSSKIKGNECPQTLALLNQRDEIVGKIQQTLYLLTFI